MTIQRSANGDILKLDDGDMMKECCCEGAPAECDCNDCPTPCYSVVVSGFTGVCSWANGTYVVDDSAFGPCYWISPNGSGEDYVEIFGDTGFHVLNIQKGDFSAAIRYTGDFLAECLLLVLTPCPDAVDGWVIDPFDETACGEPGSVVVTPTTCP